MTRSPFTFRPPAWANSPSRPTTPDDALKRADDLASSYYALAAQTGIHSMIEWCGVMAEHVKMLRTAYTAHGVEPDRVDQHSGTAVPVPGFMVAYLCEKLGCQLKPFIRADRARWRAETDKWFREVP